MTRPPITCHILDTVSGKPAQGVVCAIYKLDIDISDESTVVRNEYQFALAQTNEDGRVSKWVFDPNPKNRGKLSDLGIVLISQSELSWESLPFGTYKIRFHTAQYFSKKDDQTFFPFVDIVFHVKDSKHYHIPLLLSNYGYTTYRGS